MAGLFKTILGDKKSPDIRSVNLKKSGDTVFKEMSELDWTSRDAVYEYMEKNLYEVLYYMSDTENEYIFGFFASRPETYITIYKVIHQNPDIKIPRNLKINLNKCMYSYLIYQQSRLKPFVYNTGKEYIRMISKKINKGIFERLDYIDCVNQDLLDYLPIGRNSSFDEAINIKRVNFAIIISMSPKITSEEDLKDIYGELFYNNEDELIMNSMFEVYDFDGTALNNPERYGWMYSLITNALFQILNDKPMTYIKEFLIKYSQECLRRQVKKHDVRGSFLELSSDYDKLLYIAEELKANGYYIL